MSRDPNPEAKSKKFKVGQFPSKFAANIRIKKLCIVNSTKGQGPKLFAD